jgi:hypothetical protein
MPERLANPVERINDAGSQKHFKSLEKFGS